MVTRAERVVAPPGLLPGEAAVRGGRAVVAAGEHGVALLAGRLIQDDDTEILVDPGGIAALVDAAKAPPP